MHQSIYGFEPRIRMIKYSSGLGIRFPLVETSPEGLYGTLLHKVKSSISLKLHIAVLPRYLQELVLSRMTK